MSALDELWYPSANPSALAAAASIPLRLLATGYGAAAAFRGSLYDRGALTSHRIDGARVISVGNLNVGGAGKTPAVIHLAKLFDESVAVLSRGYGRRTSAPLKVRDDSSAEDVGDEPLLIRQRTGVNVYVGADRVALARRAVEEGARVLLLDDGMQHRRLHRDVDILVIDSSSGFGNGRTLPAGPLREPLRSARRASLVWLRTADPAAAPPPVVAHLPLVRVAYQSDRWRSPEGERDARELSGTRVVCFAAIGRPSGFLRAVEALGAEVAGSAFFRDHHFVSDGELASLEARARAARALLLTTEKDAVRLPRGRPVHVLTQRLELLSGEGELRAALGLS